MTSRKKGIIQSTLYRFCWLITTGVIGSRYTTYIEYNIGGKGSPQLLMLNMKSGVNDSHYTTVSTYRKTVVTAEFRNTPHVGF